MPFGSGVRIEEPWRRVISDCPSYSYSDTPSKSPVMVTRPSEDRSSSGIGMASKVKACTVGAVARKVDKPAAAGPNNEDTLIVTGATTGRGGQESPIGEQEERKWEAKGIRTQEAVGPKRVEAKERKKECGMERSKESKRMSDALSRPKSLAGRGKERMTEVVGETKTRRGRWTRSREEGRIPKLRQFTQLVRKIRQLRQDAP